MSPSPKTIKRGVNICTLGNTMRTAAAFEGSHTFAKQDEGNKKKVKLAYVSASTLPDGAVVKKTLGAVAAQSGQVSAVALEGTPDGSAGVASALRLAFMVAWLIALKPEVWKVWLQGKGLRLGMPVGASEGRWWSITMSFSCA